MIARAKIAGDQIWYHLKLLDLSLNNGQRTETAFDRYAAMCDAHNEGFEDTELGELISYEMFLRSGKRMSPEAKIENRKRADALKDKILRRT